jgi:hypothetical protein
MARFILIAAVIGQPPRDAYRKFPRGTTIADSEGNAEPGDVTWPSMCATPSAQSMAPLDAAAQALMPGSTIITLAQLAVSSAGGAAGENVGS